MINIKKLCMAIALLLFAAVNVSAAGKGEYELLQALEILPAEEYNTEAPVTRAELAYITALISKTPTESYTEQGEVFYKDVPADYEYSHYINAMTRLDMIRGFSDGCFEPEYGASYTDAAYAMVNVLGYREQAMKKGGYPMGYIMQANELGLFKGVSSFRNVIAQKDMNVVLYNTLKADVNVIPTSVEYDSDDEDEKTLLYRTFKTTEIKGIVSANSISSIDASAAAGDKLVVVNKETYEVSDGVDADSLLGYNVIAYIRWKDDAGTLIAAAAYNTEVVKLWDSDIEETSSVGTIMADVNGKIKKFNIDADVEYLYNGAYANGLKKEDLLIDSGYIELINNDKDSAYDIISITKYDTLFVYGVSTVNEMLTDKYGRKADLEKKNYKIFLNGEEITIDQIKKYDVVSYTKTKDDDNYRLYVTRDEGVQGMITGGRASENIIVIDSGSEYEIGSDYLELVKQGKATALSSTMEAVFYTDIRGRIMAYESISDLTSKTEMYGYLIRITGDVEDGGFYAKMLKSDGVIELMPIAASVSVDGVKYKEDDAFVKNLSNNGYIRTIVRYVLNGDEKISKLDTPTMGQNETEGVNLTGDFILARNDETWVNSGEGILEGRFYINNSTIVFEVPDDELKDDDTLYAVRNHSSFSNAGTFRGVVGYDLTSEYVARATVKYTAGSGGIERSAPFGMIESFKSVYDEESETVVPAIVLSDGNVLNLSKEELSAGLEKGDIIRYSYDAKKRVNALELECDVSQENIPTESEGSEYDSFYNYRGELRYGTYILIEASGNAFIAATLPSRQPTPEEIANDTLPADVYKFERFGETYYVQQADGRADYNSVFVYRYSGTVYVYDRATDKIEEADITVLSDVLYKNNPNARVFIKQCYGTVNYVFVIK